MKLDVFFINQHPKFLVQKYLITTSNLKWAETPSENKTSLNAEFTCLNIRLTLLKLVYDYPYSLSLINFT